MVIDRSKGERTGKKAGGQTTTLCTSCKESLFLSRQPS